MDYIPHKVLVSIGFSRQEHWSGLPSPSPGDLPNPGTEPASPTLSGRFFTAELPGKSKVLNTALWTDRSPTGDCASAKHQVWLLCRSSSPSLQNQGSVLFSEHVVWVFGFLSLLLLMWCYASFLNCHTCNPHLKIRILINAHFMELWALEEAVAAASKSLQSCPTLCDPIDDSPPGSPVPGILQARTLEWVAISFSNVWKGKVKVKLLSCVRLFTTPWSAAHQALRPWDFPGKSTGVGCQKREECKIPDQLQIFCDSYFWYSHYSNFFLYNIWAKWMSLRYTAVQETWLEMILILGWIEARFYFTCMSLESQEHMAKQLIWAQYHALNMNVQRVATLHLPEVQCLLITGSSFKTESIHRKEIPIQVCWFICIITKGE